MLGGVTMCPISSDLGSHAWPGLVSTWMGECAGSQAPRGGPGVGTPPSVVGVEEAHTCGVRTVVDGECLSQ